MAVFAPIVSPAIPLLESNVDTDQIIPAQFVNARGSERLAAALFANRRATEPNFPLNQPAMAGRQIVVAGPNFGCGSSREAAAWALKAFGIRGLVGTTFNDTFANNCLQNAIVPARLEQADFAVVERAVARAPDAVVTIDLDRGEVMVEGTVLFFAVDPFRKQLLLSGMDELDYILSRSDRIAEYEAAVGKEARRTPESPAP